MASEWNRGDYTISTDNTRLDLSVIHDYLSNNSYWATGRSLETIRRSIEHSLSFGVYKGEEQIGFARVVTDYATFALAHMIPEGSAGSQSRRGKPTCPKD